MQIPSFSNIGRLSKKVVCRILALVLSASCIDISAQSVIAALSKTPSVQFPSGFFHPTLFVVATAIASLILIALSAKWQSLRRHPLSLYLSAVAAMVGISAMWTAGMPELSMCLYIAFSFGCAFMTFYWIELLASVTAFELMVIIAGNTLATILVTLITDYLSFYEYFGILSLALGFLCLKYADDTVTSTPPKHSENASTIDTSTVARTITGLCLVGLVAGTTQSIALIEDPSCSLCSVAPSAIALVIVVAIIVNAPDVRLSTALKIISSLTAGALLLLLMPGATPLSSYFLSQIAFSVLSSIASYALALVVKSRTYHTLKAVGTTYTMLSFSSLILLVLVGLGVDITSSHFVIALSFIFICAAIWLMGDRGIDTLINPFRPIGANESPASGAFKKKAELVAQRSKLTPREADVFYLAVVGRSCPFIAEKLVLSENTIRSYLQKVYSKCGVHSRQELISLVEETSE